ncbi:hypothetical protein U1Q18_005246 [Sarracenia purpurea var. burkii]
MNVPMDVVIFCKQHLPFGCSFLSFLEVVFGAFRIHNSEIQCKQMWQCSTDSKMNQTMTMVG